MWLQWITNFPHHHNAAVSPEPKLQQKKRDSAVVLERRTVPLSAASSIDAPPDPLAKLRRDSRREIRSEPATFTTVEEDDESPPPSPDADTTDSGKKFEPKQEPPSRASGRSPTRDEFARSASAVSLPVGPSTLNGLSSLSLYDRSLHLLAVDPVYQKEVALGKRIGFYRLGKELGAGNFSKVKLGIHVLTKEKVAVKIMEKTKMDQKAQRLLAREIQCLEQLHHPNVIRLFECVETLTRMHLVMEYAGGGELYVYVHDKGKLTESEARPLFAQITAAVAHMHGLHIVHRDIKAENVMFSAPGWVKLVDFGFSCLSDPNSPLATFCGSPPYAAPELFRDKNYNGFCVDIWAMGVLLYFMLVGVTPFRGETVVELKQIIMTGSFHMPDYISTFAQHMIARMLEMDAEKRMNIQDIKKTYWLRDSRFPKSYLSVNTVPEKAEMERSEVARRVWNTMQSFGITEEMMKEAAAKGPRNAIVGTLRIVAYQVQAEDRDKQKLQKVEERYRELSEMGKKEERMLKHKSRTCTLL